MLGHHAWSYTSTERLQQLGILYRNSDGDSLKLYFPWSVSSLVSSPIASLLRNRRLTFDFNCHLQCRKVALPQESAPIHRWQGWILHTHSLNKPSKFYCGNRVKTCTCLSFYFYSRRNGFPEYNPGRAHWDAAASSGSVRVIQGKYFMNQCRAKNVCPWRKWYEYLCLLLTLVLQKGCDNAWRIFTISARVAFGIERIHARLFVL